MPRIVILTLFIAIFVIGIYLLLSDWETQSIFLLSESKNKLSFAVISFVLLTSDILLPIPSSLIMTLNGKVLGMFSGTLLSLGSQTLSSYIGYQIGRNTSTFVFKFFNSSQINRSSRIFDKYNNLGIFTSRFLPVFSETMAILCGMEKVPFRKFFFYAFIGNVFVSIIYAFVGAYYTNKVNSYFTTFIIMIVVCAAWIIEFIINKSKTSAFRINLNHK